MGKRKKGRILGILDWPVARDPVFWGGLVVAYLATFDASGRRLTHPALGAELFALVVIGLGGLRLAVRRAIRAVDGHARLRRNRRIPGIPRIRIARWTAPHGALSPVLWAHRATGLRGAAGGSVERLRGERPPDPSRAGGDGS